MSKEISYVSLPAPVWKMIIDELCARPEVEFVGGNGFCNIGDDRYELQRLYDGKAIRLVCNYQGGTRIRQEQIIADNMGLADRTPKEVAEPADVQIDANFQGLDIGARMRLARDGADAINEAKAKVKEAGAILAGLKDPETLVVDFQNGWLDGVISVVPPSVAKKAEKGAKKDDTNEEEVKVEEPETA